MGFGGATLAMVTAIRNNKKLLSNRKAHRKNYSKLKAAYTEGILQKNYTPQEIHVAKQKIRKQAEKQKQKSRLVLIITIITAPMVFYMIGYLLFQLMKFQ